MVDGAKTIPVLVENDALVVLVLGDEVSRKDVHRGGLAPPDGKPELPPPGPPADIEQGITLPQSARTSILDDEDDPKMGGVVPTSAPPSQPMRSSPPARIWERKLVPPDIMQDEVSRTERRRVK